MLGDPTPRRGKRQLRKRRRERRTMAWLRGFYAAIAAALALATNAVATDVLNFPEHAKNGQLWAMVQAQNSMLFTTQAPELWFKQKLDHFAPDSEQSGPNATFQQRYYEVNTFWKSPDGPVILYIGGEGALKNAPQGFVQELAKLFGAKILALEHRFYGNSVPQNDLSVENLKYLRVEQALADLKHFKEAYQANNMPVGVDNKWIAIGGSYPGALSAWFRIAYPNTTVASLSSSGVVQPIYKFHQFDEQVAIAAGEKCANVLRATTAKFEEEIKGGNETAVKSLLGAENLSDADFFYMLADAAAMAVQYGHKNVLCDHMVAASEQKTALTEAFANFTIQMYGKDFGNGCFYDTTCLSHDTWRWADVRSWRWQKCYQLAYFQVAPETGSLRSKLVDLDYHELQCKTVFGDVVNPSKGVKEITKLYGGNKPHGHKIYFSNGADDPWQRASVDKTLEDDEIANLAKCDLCGHCGDLGSNPDVPDPLKAQRAEIIKYLTQWLKEADGVSDAADQSIQDVPAMQTVAQDTLAVDSYRSTPLVLVPIVFAFIVLMAVLHVDAVRDANTQNRYQRIRNISRSVRELRFVACDTSQHSSGLRTFFRKNYEELKMLNPNTPFIYREADEMEPFVYARYDWGNEKQVFVHNKNDKEITEVLRGLVEFGKTLPKSPESDILVAAPIIDAAKGEAAYEPLNLTWDGKTVRRNPEFDIPLAEALKDDSRE
ncbi:TPA: hypothetical protein N0F65_010497 [Lagenidium giganteum]|uniref:Ribosomal protein/NADH dehydrogenase domain-containing protein n=1 Tax=Lagenidium giganteum TaxID=4803 RepID=A0AAV2ZAP7_9STRA|nr:TPA: hypothetical protein N0F65_010497 [Lagenidium giganteum]